MNAIPMIARCAAHQDEDYAQQANYCLAVLWCVSYPRHLWDTHGGPITPGQCALISVKLG